jgi:hypothetical protein
VYGVFAARTLCSDVTGAWLRAGWLVIWPEADNANPATATNVIALWIVSSRISPAPNEAKEQSDIGAATKQLRTRFGHIVKTGNT